MKADPSGSPSEQAFARMGWVPPKEAKAKDMRRCAACNSFFLVSTTNRDGGCGSASRCFHPMTYGNPGKGQATKDTASCRQWALREVRRG